MKKHTRPLTRFDLPKLYGTSAYEIAARQIRTKMLECYDIHRINMLTGEESETPEEHNLCAAWRRRILDLDLEAFMSIQDRPGIYRHYKQYDTGGNNA